MTTTAMAPLADAAEIRLDPLRHCLFLDFDGTLVEFADRPDAVTLPGAVRENVARLYRQLNGAVAVVSGREIAVLDSFLAPLSLPAAGVHGLMRRDGAGHLHIASFDPQILERLHAHLETFVSGQQGLILERKPGSVALHFRRRPELEASSIAAMDKAVADVTDAGGRFHMMKGKMVIEARASTSTKASAIAAFMDEPPFAGRIPVFAGDDVTDEDGFAETNARGGITIKVGPGDTCAQYRIADVAAFRIWLAFCIR